MLEARMRGNVFAWGYGYQAGVKAWCMHPSSSTLSTRLGIPRGVQSKTTGREAVVCRLVLVAMYIHFNRPHR